MSAYVATTATTSIVSLLVSYFIIGAAGAIEWGILGGVQSAVVLFAVFVAFGWGTTGAAEVAQLRPEDRPQFYADSLVSRTYLFLLVYPIAVIIMWALNPSYLLLVVVAVGAALVLQLGASWYFIGAADPARLFRFDAVPQMIGLIVSLGVVLLTRDLVATVATQFLFNLAAVVLSARAITRTATPVRWDLSVSHAARRLIGQRHSVVTAATTALYVAAPVLILNVLLRFEMLDTIVLAIYVVGERLFRLALTAYSPILQFVQGWLPEAGADQLVPRMRSAMRWAPAVAVAGAGALLLLGPFAAGILTQRDPIPFGFDMSAPFAAVFLCVALSQVLGLAVLVQLGRTKDLTTSTVLGAAIGVPLLVAGALLGGVHGVSWALAASELVVVVVQIRMVRRELRRRSSAPRS